MSPTLPQETLEEIIDHLYDDWNTLLICSLASHAFIPSTRRLLFSRISLFPREIEAAVQMFGDTHGTIARAIRHLEITDRTPPDNRHCWPDTKNVEKTPINVPLLRTRLQSLQVMRLEYICDVHIPSLFWKVTRSLAGVREIQIDQMFCDNSHQFLGFLSSFLSLKSIAVTKCHWSGQPSALIPSCAPELSHVSVLEIGSSAQQYILQWLLSQKVSLSLHTLRLNLGIDVDTAFLVNSLLEIVSPTLKELYISLENGIRGW
ncbi:hypothetical protein AMATHDRAFT_51014 [Amanita thiersii Skay4041]|uniref:F-box domain-containing protein n=1 Tax=Amanita thiersii Skay4041 TaxID=703135 RepID=A0A2A9NE02_9AGAR|nr:hypothetical protein AMATHDRAFT_51014 [Amanita thiersii Skay4041]